MKHSLSFIILVTSLCLFTSCTASPKATATLTVESHPTQATSPSPTVLPPTETPLPSVTPTPFPTLPILPTLAPATPANSAAYHISSRTAKEADEVILRMEQAIQDLENLTMQGMPPYGAYYRATAYAAWDAIIHFPNDPHVEGWRWKLAYYMALSGDGDEATRIYAQQIDKALNQQRLRPEDLPAWFKSGETYSTYFTQPFTLNLTPIINSGNGTEYLIEIGKLENTDTPGSTCLLVAGNKQGHQVYSIYNGFPQGGFFMGLRNPTSCYLKDVTGNGIDEIIVDRYEGGHVGTTSIRVYDISVLPPKVLPFYPEQEQEGQFWNGYLDHSDNSSKIRIQESLGFCDDYAWRTFEWNGKWFDLTASELDFYGEPGPIEQCFGRTQEFAKELNLRDAIKIFGQTFEAYKGNTNGFDKDFAEEFRVFKGLYSAFDGDVGTARTIFSQIADAPLLKDSAWIKPAQQFLQIYHNQSDLYRACSILTTCSPAYAQFRYPPTACIDVDLCDKKLALQYTVANAFASDPIEKIPNDLKELGMRVRQYGMLDFDKSGDRELWVTLSHPLSEVIELWVAAHSPQGIKFSFVMPSTNPKPEFAFLDDANGNVATIINETTQLKLVRHPLTGEPFVIATEIEEIDPVRQRADEFQALRQKMLAGEIDQTIFQQLQRIAQSTSRCPFTVVHSDIDGSEISYYYSCDSFYYTLALSAELTGKTVEAVTLYHKIWLEYPYSPFAILSRLKLQQ